MAETNPQIEQQNPRITWDGCSVLLDINDGDRLVFSRLSAGASLKIGDKKCSLRPLIGCPFGSLFQVETGPKGPFLTRILASAEGDQQEKGEFESKEEMKDNRALVDNNTAQTLSGEDINAMRRQGATGDQIVEALIANSSTFANKTSFSQVKYRVKKQKKYAPRVLLRRPFARSICEAYFKKYPARIGFLRVDALSLLLSLANVSAYSDVLVVDMVGGMLTGAVAERLGGNGYVCNAYLGATPYQMDIVRIFNFNNKICSRILRSPLSDLCLAQSDISEQPEPLEIASSSQFQSNVAECISSCASLPKPEDQMIKDVSGPSSNPICNEETTLKSENEMPDAVPKSIDETDASSVVRPCKAAKAGEKASQQNINLWKENGFSSLIIAAPDQDAWSIVKELLPLLSYSAPFTIYHQYLQPLATCMHNLQVAKMAIGLQISEPWLREYQNFVDLVQGVAPNPKFLQEDSCIKILTSLLLHQDVTNFDVEYLSGLVDCIDWLNLADIDSCRVHEKHVTPGVCWLLYCTCNPELFLFDCTQVFANAYCETSFAKYFLMI